MQCAINRDRTGADDSNAQRYSCQSEGVLITLAAIEKTVLEVDGGDCNEHHADDQRRRERRGESERQENPTSKLRQAGKQRVAPPREEAELLQKSTGALQTVPAEPAEQLLRAVRRHGEADDEPQDEKTESHS